MKDGDFTTRLHDRARDLFDTAEAARDTLSAFVDVPEAVTWRELEEVVGDLTDLLNEIEVGTR